MKLIKANNLICPIDGLALILNDNQQRCEAGHSYDVARQGYVNLLPVQHKRSKNPGDSKAMVDARTAFLNTAVYQPIADKLAEICAVYMEKPQAYTLFDAGCGEGYYFDYLSKQLNSDLEHTFIGIDISKPAILAAAKRNKDINWVVASNRQPPVTDNSVDIIICIFGFQHYSGFNRILKSHGLIVLVEPGTHHLDELKDIIYADKKTASLDEDVIWDDRFIEVEQKSLSFKTGDLNNEQINHLLLMTPHLFRANKQGKEKASQLQSLNISVDVVFTILKKK